MRVNALDHVNIIAEDLHGTARFYAELLSLEILDAPAPLTRDTAQWLYDADGRAIFHINSVDCIRAYDRAVEPGNVTGAIHHVALNCSGYDEIIRRLEDRSLDFQTNFVGAIGLKQIFVSDPNGVLLELNFFGD
jgi:catechol 2,3-dioxygenase-like lactoylglutathione lyase family enzyme